MPIESTWEDDASVLAFALAVTRESCTGLVICCLAAVDAASHGLLRILHSYASERTCSKCCTAYSISLLKKVNKGKRKEN